MYTEGQEGVEWRGVILNRLIILLRKGHRCLTLNDTEVVAMEIWHDRKQVKCPHGVHGLGGCRRQVIHMCGRTEKVTQQCPL